MTDCQAEGHVYELGLSHCIICHEEADWLDRNDIQLTAWPVYVGLPDLASWWWCPVVAPYDLVIGDSEYYLLPANWCWVPT